MIEALETPHVDLLGVGETADYIEILRNTMPKLFPVVHHLELPRSLRRFPVPYMDGVKTAIEDATPRKRQEHALAFAVSPLGQFAIEAAEHSVVSELIDETREGYIQAARVSEILHLGPGTITDWRNREDVETLKDGRELYVATSSLFNACTWRRPGE